MAGIITQYRGNVDANIVEFTIDSENEIQYLPTTTSVGTGDFSRFDKTVPIGSTCIVGNENGDLLVYMLFSFGWKKM